MLEYVVRVSIKIVDRIKSSISKKVLLSLNNLRKLNILKHKSSFGRIESRKYDIAFRNLVSGTKEFTRWF